MLFSGLGPDAQQQLSVGVGALAGSTIMLLTVPWSMAIFAGSVPVGSTGHALYGRKAIEAERRMSQRRLTLSRVGGGLWSRGITPYPSIKDNAKLMVATACCYLIIQGEWRGCAWRRGEGEGGGRRVGLSVERTDEGKEGEDCIVGG